MINVYVYAVFKQVDGVVIRHGLSNQDTDEHTGRGQSKRSQDAFGRYDLMFGVVTGEALWRFSATDIQNGFEGERRDKIIRTYVRNAYTYHLSEIFYTVNKCIVNVILKNIRNSEYLKEKKLYSFAGS